MYCPCPGFIYPFEEYAVFASCTGTGLYSPYCCEPGGPPCHEVVFPACVEAFFARLCRQSRYPATAAAIMKARTANTIPTMLPVESAEAPELLGNADAGEFVGSGCDEDGVEEGEAFELEAELVNGEAVGRVASDPVVTRGNVSGSSNKDPLTVRAVERSEHMKLLCLLLKVTVMQNGAVLSLGENE